MGNQGREPLLKLLDKAWLECENLALTSAAEQRWEDHFGWEHAADIVHTAQWRVLDSGESAQEVADFIRCEIWHLRSTPKRVLACLERKLRRCR